LGEAITQPFIHFHIPKTAGTSLRAVFIDQFGAERVAFLLPDRSLVQTSDLPFKTESLDRIRRIARGAGLLNLYSAGVGAINRRRLTKTFSLSAIEQQDIALATGHFTHTDIVDGDVEHLPRTTILRQPLERTWSHYGHWREAKGAMWWHKGGVTYTDDTSFETFALDPQLANYQSLCLGNLSFAAVGVSTNLPAFFEKLGIQPPRAIPVLNPGRTNMPTFDPGFIRDFEALHAEDYARYEAAS